jgi:hypothetical protein
MICTDCLFSAPFEHFVVRKGTVLECRKCNGRSISQGSSPQVVGADSPYQQAAYITTENDVRNLKNELKRYEDATNVAVQNCAAIPAAEKRGWDDFRTEFYRFYIEKEGSALPYILAPATTAFMLREQMQRAEGYRTELENWQKRLSPYCGGSVGPSIAELRPVDPGILDRLSQAEKDAKDTALTFQKYALWGGIALLAVLGFVAFTNIKSGEKFIEKMPVIP